VRKSSQAAVLSRTSNSPPTNTTKWVIHTSVPRQEPLVTSSVYLLASTKLTGEDNWPLFKDAIGNLLGGSTQCERVLGKFISVKAKPPKQVDDEDESDLAKYSKWKDWKANGSKAKLILLYNVDKSCVICGKKSAKGMMNSLNQRYEDSG
jgi:hypothetical protein